jgi:hypothetical protein
LLNSGFDNQVDININEKELFEEVF